MRGRDVVNHVQGRALLQMQLRFTEAVKKAGGDT